MSVRRAQQEVDSQEFAEWIAYYRLDPFGPERADLGWATVAATIANVWRGKGQRALKPSDFMPDFERGHRRQPAEQMRDIMNAFAQAHNAKSKHNGRNRNISR